MPSREQIAESFDRRAAVYAKGDWHRQAADRLIALCQLARGARVLDAATGTGFAALAASRAVGFTGRIVGIDLSAGMLREAAAAASARAVTNVEWLQGDVTSLPQFPDDGFDAITCASGLLYMPIAAALGEWHRLLRPAGRVAISEIAAGSPHAARLFRDLAVDFGLQLVDPCAALGSTGAARSALESAGFEVESITVEPVAFSTRDFDQAWEANFRSPGHAAVQQLPDASRDLFRARYLEALRRLEHDGPQLLTESRILYAIGRKAGPTAAGG